MSEVPRPRGRPRSATARAAILLAARELLEEGGLLAVTIEAIATRSGISKPTIYRSFKNGHAVAMAAFLESVQASPARETSSGRPGSGAVRAGARASGPALADLGRHLRKVAETFASRTGRSVAALIAASQSETELAKAFRTHFILASREEGRLILQRAIEQEEVRPDVDLEVALDLLYAPLYFRLLVGHGALTSAFTDSVVAHALVGLGAEVRRRKIG